MIPIIDLHCHPCLKIYLVNHNISILHHPSPDVSPLGMHVDLPGMLQSNVRVACCSHYVPEAGFGHLSNVNGIFQFLRLFFRNIIEKFEGDANGSGTVVKAKNSIDLLNHQVQNAQGMFDVVIAKNLVDFNEGLASGKTVLLHCLEGSHHLGKNLASAQDYINHLNSYKHEGLCILTLSHFFQNSICDSGGGIPPSTARHIGYAKPNSTTNGLSSVGKDVVRWCFENGVIIDLVHSTEDTRKQVYEIIAERKNEGKKPRPVIFSHTGIKEMAVGKMSNLHDLALLPDANELQIIKDTGGVAALILMNYWLTGEEEDDLLTVDNGITHIIKTVEFIHGVLGDFENIAIGTDLDGFTQVPDDLMHVRFLGGLSTALKNKFGISAAEKICFENALRVIREGWS